MARRNPLLLASALLLCACDPGKPNVEVPDAWVRGTVAGQTSTAAYFTIKNDGNGADRLLSVETPVATSAELHSSTSSGGIARMRPLPDGLEVPAGRSVTLKPGGAHVMLLDLREPLQAGTRIPLRLRFAKSGEMRAEARVVTGTGTGEGHGHAA